MQRSGAGSHGQQRAAPLLNTEHLLACSKCNGTAALMAPHCKAQLAAAAQKELFVEQEGISKSKRSAEVTDKQVDFMLRDLEGGKEEKKKKPFLF